MKKSPGLTYFYKNGLLSLSLCEVSLRNGISSRFKVAQIITYNAFESNELFMAPFVEFLSICRLQRDSNADIRLKGT